MAIAWDSLEKRYVELADQLANPALETSKRTALQKEFSNLSLVLQKHREILQTEQKIEQAKKDAASLQDAELAQMFADELLELQLQLAQKQRELDDILFPADERNDRSVYLEIRAGAGGQEAALFVADLQKMYTNYAQKNHWRVTVESFSATDLGGYREIILHVQGKGVYGHLKYESGVHRVQRVPPLRHRGAFIPQP